MTQSLLDLAISGAALTAAASLLCAVPAEGSLKKSVTAALRLICLCTLLSELAVIFWKG